jgi:hypothetical protein
MMGYVNVAGCTFQVATCSLSWTSLALSTLTLTCSDTIAIRNPTRGACYSNTASWYYNYNIEYSK